MYLFIAKFRPFKGMKSWWYKMILAPDEIEAAKVLCEKNWLTSTGRIKYIRRFQKYHLLLLPKTQKILYYSNPQGESK